MPEHIRAIDEEVREYSHPWHSIKDRAGCVSFATRVVTTCIVAVQKLQHYLQNDNAVLASEWAEKLFETHDIFKERGSGFGPCTTIYSIFEFTPDAVSLAAARIRKNKRHLKIGRGMLTGKNSHQLAIALLFKLQKALRRATRTQDRPSLAFNQGQIDIRQDKFISALMRTDLCPLLDWLRDEEAEALQQIEKSNCK